MARPVCSRLTVHADPGTDPWVVRQADAQRIACMLAKDVIVEYHPRSAIQRVWSTRHGGAPLPVPEHSFRAWSRDGRAVLFVDRSETYQSALWLLLHELAHLDLMGSPLLTKAYRSIAKPKGYLSSDIAHESHPEEQLANLVATRVLGLIGHDPFAYDRLWWRRNRGERISGSACVACGA